MEHTRLALTIGTIAAGGGSAEDEEKSISDHREKVAFKFTSLNRLMAFFPKEEMEAFISDYREIAASEIAQTRNIVIVGPAGSGKSALLSSLVENIRQEYQLLESFKDRHIAYSQCHELAHLNFQQRGETKEVEIWQQIAGNISSEFPLFNAAALLVLDVSRDELNINEGLKINKSIIDLLLANIDKKLKIIKRDLRYARKLMSLIIRLQYIARETHNRVSESPTPIKKEPPIGGIKVGGEQHAFCHAA